MNLQNVHENPSHHMRPHWDTLMDHILAVETMTVSFRDRPEELAIILDKLRMIDERYIGHKKTLPFGYRRHVVSR
jgi:hypothetical protein